MNIKNLGIVALLILLLLACGSTSSITTTKTAVTEAPTMRPTFTPIATAEAPSAPTAEGKATEPVATTEPISTPPPAVVLQGVTAHTLSFGGYEIVGEAINQSADNLQFVKVIASCYDADGRIIATDYSYTDLDVIEANSHSPFSVTFMETPQGLDSYKLHAEWRTTTNVPLHVDILSHSPTTSSYGGYNVVGEIHNPYDFDLVFVKIVGTFYNAANEVLAVDYTYTDLDTIGTGGTSPFEVVLMDTPKGLDHYVLQSQARAQD